jgi:glycosyltransferase involved in cell wall biosynthesis
MRKKNKLSVIIIAKNEEKMIEDCLQSVKWAKEIILLDGGSKDKTLEIARKYGAKIMPQEAKGEDWGAWHNQGIKVAGGNWILYVDADERITPELKKEIQKVMGERKGAAFAMPRLNILLGRPLRFGGWYPDYQIRLFRKEKLKKWEGKLHERPIFEGSLVYLKNYMIHLSHRDLFSMVEKTKKWSDIEANLLLKAHHPPVVWWRILRIMLTEFFQRFIKYQAWRDGTVGWIEGLFQVFNKFLIYARLWELQNQK